MKLSKTSKFNVSSKSINYYDSFNDMLGGFTGLFFFNFQELGFSENPIKLLKKYYTFLLFHLYYMCVHTIKYCQW